MSISIRNHCIACYDEISRINKVSLIPDHLAKLDETKAGGIICKLKSIIESDFFKSLPDTAIIVSSWGFNFEWKKQDAIAECDRIWKETKAYL